MLVGHDDFDVGCPRVIGITIGKKIHAAFPRGFDNPDVFRSFAPNGDRADLDVRMLDRDMGALTDGDFLFQGLEALVAFVADVGHVEAVIAGCSGGHEHEFVGVAVAADFVLKA